jgi:hypothetical protein
MTICFSAPVRSTELIGGKGPSNRISTTLPRTDATTPRLDEVVVVSMIASAYVRSIMAVYSPRRAARLHRAR